MPIDLMANRLVGPFDFIRLHPNKHGTHVVTYRIHQDKWDDLKMEVET